jgi:hypothetical protein
MGPIEGSQFTVGQLNTLLDNEKFIKDITNILSFDDLSGFTAGGRDPMNIATSRAKLNSTTGKYLGAAEGRTPASLSKEVMRRSNENAILRAAQELARPMESAAPARTPPSIPGSGSGLGTLARSLNPILTFLQLLTQPIELNTGEREWVENKRKMEDELLRKLQQHSQGVSGDRKQQSMSAPVAPVPMPTVPVVKPQITL